MPTVNEIPRLKATPRHQKWIVWVLILGQWSWVS